MPDLDPALGPLWVEVRGFALALLIGALIGLEREKRKAAERDHTIGGIRTFILFAQAGALSTWLALRLEFAWLLAAGLAGACALVVTGYVVQVRRGAASLGLTTEVAAVITFLLGAACVTGPPALAVALGIVTSAVLAWKQPIHGLVEKIGTDDLYAGLKLLIASFIVLPLLPQRAIDPWGVLRPYELWLLVVLISGLSLVGYVSVRWLGTGRGAVITGVAGGLVSSTAVTLTFARRSRDPEAVSGGPAVLAAGLLVAWTVMFARVLVIAAAIHAPLAARLLVPFATMGVVSLVAAVLLVRAQPASPRTGHVDLALRNPFSLTSAMSFAAFFAVVLLVVELARRALPATGVYAVAALAGLTDVDAITLSLATMTRDGGELRMATAAITVAALTNTAVKAGITAVLGTRPLAVRVAIVTVAIFAAGAIALLW